MKVWEVWDDDLINDLNYFKLLVITITCSKSTIETLEKDVKYVQS